MISESDDVQSYSSTLIGTIWALAGSKYMHVALTSDVNIATQADARGERKLIYMLQIQSKV
jgi:hypothetical protein